MRTPVDSKGDEPLMKMTFRLPHISELEVLLNRELEPSFYTPKRIEKSKIEKSKKIEMVRHKEAALI